MDSRSRCVEPVLRRAFLCGLFLLLGGVGAILAATITVNSAADVAADDGQCTLREAINAANNNAASGITAGECSAGTAGPDTIVFNIGGGGLQTITPTSGLPPITELVTIDGFSQLVERQHEPRRFRAEHRHRD